MVNITGHFLCGKNGWVIVWLVTILHFVSAVVEALQLERYFKCSPSARKMLRTSLGHNRSDLLKLTNKGSKLELIKFKYFNALERQLKQTFLQNGCSLRHFHETQHLPSCNLRDCTDAEMAGNWSSTHLAILILLWQIIINLDHSRRHFIL